MTDALNRLGVPILGVSIIRIVEFLGLYWAFLVYGSYICLEPSRKGRSESVTTQMTTISWPVNPFTYATGSLIGMNANVTVPCETQKCCSGSTRKFETACVVISNTLLEVRGPCAFSRQAAACCSFLLPASLGYQARYTIQLRSCGQPVVVQAGTKLCLSNC